MDPLLGSTRKALEIRDVLTKQQRIAELARQMPDAQLWSLSHHIDKDWMHEAYRRTRKDGAAGVDQVTAQEYEKELDKNLQDLLERYKSGQYRAQPVKRAYVVKDEKTRELRPIGIPVLEDKIVQRAVLMVLEPLYEQDFLDCSHGFRPGRSVHQTLEVLWKAIRAMGRGCWILEVDIRKFFDTVEHGHIRAFLSKRVGDGVIRRTVGKWLKAGVMEDGEVHYAEAGTPQGGVISPMLSNIYLHEVLDTWFERDIQPRLQGKSRLIRFADDYVVLFETEADARRVLAVTPKRLEKYGLKVHEDKTRIVDFRKPAEGAEPGVFDFLGFTHYWGKSRRGFWTVKRKTSGKKLRKAIRKVFEKCKEQMHEPVKEQWQSLSRTLRGHYAFYGITFNEIGIKGYYEAAKRAWKMWLGRRTNDAQMTWDRFNKLLERYPLPKPHIVHKYA